METETSINLDILSADQPTRIPKEQLSGLLDEQTAPYLVRLLVILPLLGLLHWLVASQPAGWWLLAAYMAMGFLMSGLMVLAHEMSHFHLVRNPTLNGIVGTIMALPLGVPYGFYGLAHLKHHAYNTTERDPSYYGRPANRLVHYLALATHYTSLTFLMSLVSGLEQLFVSEMKGIKPSRTQYVLVASQYLVLFGLLFLFPSAWVWHFLLPLFAFAFWNTVRAIGEHEYLYDGEDGYKRPAQTTRSLRMGWLTRFFWWNAGYHIEHHLYPSVPFHNLPKIGHMLGLKEADRMGYLQYMRYRFQRGVEYPMYF